MRIGRKEPKLTREQAMSSLPLRNQALVTRRLGNGETEITVPLRSDWLGKLLAFIFFVPRERKIVLETIGSAVWERCDGQHSVAQIAESLAKQHKLSRREAELSLTEYLRRLGKRRLIAFAVPKAAGEQKPLNSAQSRAG